MSMFDAVMRVDVNDLTTGDYVDLALDPQTSTEILADRCSPARERPRMPELTYQ